MKNWLVLSLVVVFSVAAAPPIEWELTDARFAETVIGDYSPLIRDAVLSPDGSKLAWGARRDGLCLYDLIENTQTCTAWPELYDTSGTSLVWSADSQTLAFTEDFFYRFHESDIWIYEVATQTFTNRTDDGVYDDLLSEDFNGQPDYFPLWNPANHQLYFFRSLFLNTDDQRYSLELFRLNGDEAEQVADFTTTLPEISIIRPPQFSPDGTKLALPIAGRERNETRNGLWIYDLTNGSLTHLITLPDFAATFPEWTDPASYFYIENLQWAGNAALVVYLYDSSFNASFGSVNYYYVDLTTAQLTPLVDFSDYASQAELFERDDKGQSLAGLFPRIGVVAPDAQYFFYVHYEQISDSDVYISALALPPGGSEPQQIGLLQNEGAMPSIHAPSMSPDGTTYLFSYVMKFEKQ